MSQSVSPVLRECHRLRRHLRDLQAEIDLGPRVLKIQQKTLADEDAAHKEHHDAIKRWKLKQKDDEGSLKTTETRLLKVQTDLNSATSSRATVRQGGRRASPAFRRGCRQWRRRA